MTTTPETPDTSAAQLTPELLDQLMPAIADRVASDMRTFLSEQISPLAERMEAIEQSRESSPEPSQDDADEDDQPSPLELRIKQLETALADKERAEKQTRFDATLRDAVDAAGAQYPKQAIDYLRATLATQVDEKKGRWLAKDGRDLNELVTEFFSSDFGKHLLPSQAVDGVGASQAESKTQQRSNRDAEIIAALI